MRNRTRSFSNNTHVLAGNQIARGDPDIKGLVVVVDRS